jgi:PAS domain S-box-containing protein
MAHPKHIAERIAAYGRAAPELAGPVSRSRVPDLFGRKRDEDELRRSHDELENQVAARTGELLASNAALTKTNRTLEAVVSTHSAFLEDPDGDAGFARLLAELVAVTESRRGVIFKVRADAPAPAPFAPLAAAGVELDAQTADEEVSRLVAAASAARAPVQSFRTEHAVALPLFAKEGALVGAVWLAERPDGYDADTLDSVRPLLVTGATLIAVRRDRRRRAEAEREAELLKTLAIAIGSAPDFTTALQLTVRTICEVTGWDIGSTWGVGPGGERLERLPAFYTSVPSLERFAPHLDPRQYARGEGAVGRVWATGQPLLTRRSDAERDSGRFPYLSIARALGLAVTFNIPVLAAGEFVLLFEFASTELRPEDDRFFALVTVISHQIAAILEFKRVSEENASFFHALDSLQEPVHIYTPRGAPGGHRTLYANPAYARLFGYASRDAAVGASLSTLWGPATDTQLTRRVGDELGRGKSSRGELVFYRLDGTELEVEFSASPVFDPSGRHIMNASVLRDLAIERREAAERNELEARVATANAAWRQTFDIVGLPITLLDETGHVVRVNRAARDLAGIGWEELVGRSIHSFGAREPWATVGRLISVVLASGRVADVQAPDSESGQTWDISISPVPQSGGVLVVARDITHVLELRESLQKSETMAALGRMVAGVSHEVRNPLFGMGATVDAMEARFKDSDDYAPYLRVLRGELARMAALMSDLLEYGRPPRLQLTRSSLRDIVDEAIARCSTHAATAVVELRHAAGETASPLVDRGRLLQVFINLIDNAVSISPVAGVVTVSHSQDDESASVHVEDEGPGIPPEDLARLFEPFFSKRKGGTGLGLSIVQRIVEQHDGRIVAENRARRGARLTVVLPTRSNDG